MRRLAVLQDIRIAEGARRCGARGFCSLARLAVPQPIGLQQRSHRELPRSRAEVQLAHEWQRLLFRHVSTGRWASSLSSAVTQSSRTNKVPLRVRYWPKLGLSGRLNFKNGNAACARPVRPLALAQHRRVAGLAVEETGNLVSVEKAQTLTEAQRRANELRTDLKLRKVHPDVLRFCKEELLKDDYFHAVLEATKSVAEKLRTRTGLTDDGATLVDRTLSGELPLLAINFLKTDSERSEQRGLPT